MTRPGPRLPTSVRMLTIIPLLVAVVVGYATPPAAGAAKTATLSFGTLQSVSRAADGDTIEISGEGTFTLQPKSANGDGGAVAEAFGGVPRTFTHRDGDGKVVDEGTWEPTDVLSYQSYGPATDEQNAELGGLPPGSEGGKLAITAALYVEGVHVHDAIITIVCHLGSPPKNAVESTLVLVQGTGDNFNAPVSGDNIFIRQ
jgi:hypothetical protein